MPLTHTFHLIGRLRSTARRAFTLVELLIVIAIIGILIGILIPALGGARDTARKSSTTALMTSVSTAINQFRAQNGRLPGHFSQSELAQSTESSGLTQMENALLELAGGLDPDAAASENYVFTVTIGGRMAVINTLKVGAKDGPGFLNLGAKFQSTGSRVGNTPVEGGWIEGTSGLAPARPNADQIGTAEIFTNQDKYQMPDIIDSYGKPVMLWSKNESHGTNPAPAFALLNAPPTSSPARQGLYYWRTNFGYLGSVGTTQTRQTRLSAIGSITPDTQRLRSLRAALGHPAFPVEFGSVGDPDSLVPASARGDYVLHSAGRDAIFLESKDAITEYRYLPKGIDAPAAWLQETGWRRIEDSDDLFLSGN